MTSSPPRPRPPGGPTVAVNYGRDLGWNGHAEIEVQRDGDTTAVTTFNDGTPEIGWWRAPVPRAAFDELVARLHASGYDGLASGASVSPGTKVVTLGERLENEQVPVLYAFVTVPPPLAPVVASLEGIAAQVRAHPLRVLHGSAEWAGGGLSHGGEAVVVVTLTNAGTEPLAMSNPLHDFADPRGRAGGWNGLRFAFAGEGGGDERQVDLTAADVRPSPDAVRTETLLLKPGESLRFEAHKKVALPGGRYRSRVEYASVATRADDPSFVEGVLWIELGPLSAQGGPWWKVW
jgi:hypothetical protein